MIHRILTSATFLIAILPASAAGADKERIRQAVDRGIEHLRDLQAADGSWPAHYVGGTALAGLTLLECDVPSSDPAIKQAGEFVRKSWTDINDEYTTYAISLAILFLDRLGDPADTPIIQALGVRLLAGQNGAGGWTYMCPPLGADDLRQFKAMIERQVELKTRAELPKAGTKSVEGRPALPKEIKQILGRLEQRGIPAIAQMENMLAGGGGDNSNTQFAILGLWAARRHGVPVEKALARAESRFRGSQNGDGGWGYTSGGGMGGGFAGGGGRRGGGMRGFGGFGGSTGSMTCAGLLGMAAGLGSAREASMRTVLDPKAAKAKAAKTPPDPTKDPVIHNGLNALANVIGQPLRGAGRGDSAVGLGDMYYLLWSVERVAVAYSLPTIGKKDWYAWGSQLLLDAQQADGGWTGKFGSGVDTSFALLFLRRVNLTRDLTAFLKGRDAMEVALRGGGVMPRDGQGEKGRAVDAENQRPGDKETGRRGDKKPDRGSEEEKERVGDAAPKRQGDKESGRQEEPKLERKVEDSQKPKPTEVSPPPLAPSTSPLPVAPAPDESAARLAGDFLKTSGARQERLLEELKKSKGGAYTSALANAIDQLSGSLKTKAREALAERLARMTPATLRDMLQDETPEIRRAAALACAMKEEKEFIPELAKLLDDPEAVVARAAYSALKEITGEDFGPSPNASHESRRRAAEAYVQWWQKQNASKESK